MSFAVRGLLEGFYDRLWSWAERERVAAFVARHGFNTYVHAPKEDRLQNAGWRTPYPAADDRALAAFGDRCHAAGMMLWDGLRPVGISYRDDDDIRLVIDRLRRSLALGADRVLLLADDIPAELDARAAGRFASLADAHAWLVEGAANGVGAERLVFCPTDYFGMGTPYLATLARSCPPGVELCWTGPEVCSAAIGSQAASAIARVLGRAPLIWDNYPVNDAGMARELHIGPIRGRSPDLDAHVAGILVNPALQPEATLIPLATWGEYLADPQGYLPDAAWERAVLEVAGSPDDASVVLTLAAAFDRSVIPQGWTPPTEAERRAAVGRLGSLRNRALADDLAALVAPPAEVSAAATPAITPPAAAP